MQDAGQMTRVPPQHICLFSLVRLTKVKAVMVLPVQCGKGSETEGDEYVRLCLSTLEA